MAIGPLAPVARQQFFDDLGAPLAGGKLYTFLSGTGTQSSIYTDAGLTVAHPNPAILDAAGRITIYMRPDVPQWWKLATATAGVGEFVWTVDPVTPPNLIVPTADTFQLFEFGGNSATSFSNTSYPAGAGFDKTHAGTAALAIDPVNIPSGSYFLRAMFIGSQVSVSIMDLSAGSPDTPLATAGPGTSTPAPGLMQSGLITFPAGGSTHRFGIKVKLGSGSGTVWGVKLSKSLPT